MEATPYRTAEHASKYWPSTLDDLMVRTINEHQIVVNYHRDVAGGRRWDEDDIDEIREAGKGLQATMRLLRAWEQKLQAGTIKGDGSEVREAANKFGGVCEKVLDLIDKYEHPVPGPPVRRSLVDSRRREAEEEEDDGGEREMDLETEEEDDDEDEEMEEREEEEKEEQGFDIGAFAGWEGFKNKALMEGFGLGELVEEEVVEEKTGEETATGANAVRMRRRRFRR